MVLHKGAALEAILEVFAADALAVAGAEDAHLKTLAVLF
jgi:hypothetical protein